MSTPHSGSSISVVLVRHLKHYAGRLGLDFDSVLCAVGVDIDGIGDGRKRITGQQFEHMWRLVTAAGEDLHPGLSFGLEVGKSSPGQSILFTLMMNCPTIGHALDSFVRYHRVMADAIQPRIDRHGDRVHLSWDTAKWGDRHLHPDLSEAILCIFLGILTHLSQGQLTPIEVCFTHVAPKDTSVYGQTFKAPIRFGAQWDALIIPAHALANEIHLADRDLFGILERHAAQMVKVLGEDTHWSGKVKRLAREMLIKGVTPDIDAVSKALALSRRNLQAKLTSEASTYRGCLETVRKEMALDIMTQPDVAISEVAFVLGYSEQSAFNHAFKRWTGKSPKVYLHEST